MKSGAVTSALQSDPRLLNCSYRSCKTFVAVGLVAQSPNDGSHTWSPSKLPRSNHKSLTSAKRLKTDLQSGIFGPIGIL